MSVNGTLVEDKMRGFKGECAHFGFNKCPFYNHDGASAKFSTNSQETDISAGCRYWAFDAYQLKDLGEGGECWDGSVPVHLCHNGGCISV